jgi:hypothetical protein
MVGSSPIGENLVYSEGAGRAFEEHKRYRRGLFPAFLEQPAIEHSGGSTGEKLAPSAPRCVQLPGDKEMNSDEANSELEYAKEF